MANIKFTEFPSATVVGSMDIIPIVQDGANKKTTASVFSTYIGTLFVNLTGTQTITGSKTFSSQLISNVATGTAPFSIASTTKVTNLNADLLDGLSSADFQATLSGTGIVKSTAGTISYLTDNTATWDTAYNDSIVSAAVTGTTTKTLTLNQQDGGTVTASWTDINTDAVSSVFGRTGAVVAASGDYTTTQVTEGTNLYYTEARVNANTNVAANTAARHNAVTLGTANGLSLSTQQLSLGLASGSTTGALSSTDWTTFNNKQNALTNPITGTGTTNYLPKFTGTSALGNSSIFDNGTSVGIGTATPNAFYKLDINGGVHISSGNFYRYSTDVGIIGSGTSITTGLSTQLGIRSSSDILFATNGANERMRITSAGNVGIGTTSPSERLSVASTDEYLLSWQRTGDSKRWAFGADSSGTFISNRTDSVLPLFIKNNGNVLIGTTTDAGYKLDINGTARVSGAATFSSSVAGTSFTANNRTILTNGGLYDNATNGNNIGIGFAVSTIISTTGNGTYTAQNLGNSTYPWASATFSSSVTATTAKFTAIPTSSAGLSAGDIWNDGGTLKIV